MPGRFIGVPEVPEGALTEVQVSLFNSLKENVELLTGTRGENDLASLALVRSDVAVNQLGQQDMARVSARGEGFTISGQDVASLTDFSRLINDVQILANDLVRTRDAFDRLVRSLGG